MHRSWRSAYAVGAAVALFGSVNAARANDQQLVENYLKSRGASTGAVVRPITDDYVGRTFPDFSFFGVIFRQYPVAVMCPQAQDLKCSNVSLSKMAKLILCRTSKT